jgi:hypothetical protein
MFTKFDNCLKGVMRDTVSAEPIRVAVHSAGVAARTP